MDERRIQTIRNISRKHGLDLPSGWEQDASYGQALLNHLEEDSRRNPPAKILSFLKRVMRQVEADETVDDLAVGNNLPRAFAVTMYGYARKQLGYEELDEEATSFRELEEDLTDDLAESH